jgi:hypothetical protein
MKFAMQDQLQDMWCWAAVAATVSDCHEPAPKWNQCQIAKQVLGLEQCCSHPPPQEECNRTAYLEVALRTVGRFDHWAERASFETVHAELAANRLVCARIEWPDGGGHFVIIGLCWPRTQWLGIYDPIFVDYAMSYDEFSNAYLGDGRWTHTYFVR